MPILPLFLIDGFRKSVIGPDGKATHIIIHNGLIHQPRTGRIASAAAVFPRPPACKKTNPGARRIKNNAGRLFIIQIFLCSIVLPMGIKVHM